MMRICQVHKMQRPIKQISGWELVSLDREMRGEGHTSLNQIFCNAFSSQPKPASNSVNKFHHLMPWSAKRKEEEMYCLPK